VQDLAAPVARVSSDRGLDVAADRERAVVAVRRGDADELSRLVAELTPAMLRLARGLTGSAAGAEDVVQDAWLTVLTGIDRFEARSALRTWIIGIVVNKARRSAAQQRRVVPLSGTWWAERRESREPAVDPDRFAAPGAAQPPGTWLDPPRRWDLPEDELAAGELRSVFEAALAELPTR
jgi:RNA polymerase sigma-70 factor (ECF subfamily)